MPPRPCTFEPNGLWHLVPDSLRPCCTRRPSNEQGWTEGRPRRSPPRQLRRRHKPYAMQSSWCALRWKPVPGRCAAWCVGVKQIRAKFIGAFCPELVERRNRGPACLRLRAASWRRDCKASKSLLDVLKLVRCRGGGCGRFTRGCLISLASRPSGGRWAACALLNGEYAASNAALREPGAGAARLATSAAPRSPISAGTRPLRS